MTVYLKSQNDIQKKDHKLFLNEQINKNLSFNLSVLHQEIKQIEQAISSLGITVKQDSGKNAASGSLPSKIKSEQDLDQANSAIKDAILSLNRSVEDNIAAINTALNKVGIDEVLKNARINSFLAHQKAMPVDASYSPIKESPGSFPANTLSELKYKIDYMNKLQTFISTLPTKLPVLASRVTSGYGVRIHPIYGKKMMHHGVDFKGPSRAPVQATANGVVKFAGWSNSFGNVVMINHSNDIMTVYAHLSSIKVATGGKIKKGDVVGLQGSTGRSSSEHVHYETRYKGKSINPAKFIQLNQVMTKK